MVSIKDVEESAKGILSVAKTTVDAVKTVGEIIQAGAAVAAMFA